MSLQVRHRTLGRRGPVGCMETKETIRERYINTPVDRFSIQCLPKSGQHIPHRQHSRLYSSVGTQVRVCAAHMRCQS